MCGLFIQSLINCAASIFGTTWLFTVESMPEISGAENRTLGPSARSHDMDSTFGGWLTHTLLRVHHILASRKQNGDIPTADEQQQNTR